VKCVVIGGSGQDGILLSAQMLAEGHEVITVSRSPSPLSDVHHVALDVRDHDALASLITQLRPDELYYLAARHASSEAPERPFVSELTESVAVHAISFAAMLEAIAARTPYTRIVYASSSRVFGRGNGQQVNEASPRIPGCAYGISKAAGMSTAENYRHTRDLFVTNAILFNHESELRGPTFIVKKLAAAAIAARADPRSRVVVNALDDATDWGDARDYVRAMRMMLRASEPDDFVVATGTSHTVRELATECFAALGLNWAEHVESSQSSPRPPRRMAGDATKLRNTTGWTPTLRFDELIRHIVMRMQRHGSERATDFHSYL